MNGGKQRVFFLFFVFFYLNKLRNRGMRKIYGNLASILLWGKGGEKMQGGTPTAATRGPLIR